jgi:hypothetical protein
VERSEGVTVPACGSENRLLVSSLYNDSIDADMFFVKRRHVGIPTTSPVFIDTNSFVYREQPEIFHVRNDDSFPTLWANAFLPDYLSGGILNPNNYQ